MLLLKKITFIGCGGAGVIVTDGDKSFTPGGNPVGARPSDDLWGGCGTDRFVLLFKGELVKGGPWMLERAAGGC